MTNRCPDSFKLGDESLLAFYFFKNTRVEKYDTLAVMKRLRE